MASIDRPSSTVQLQRLRALLDRLWRPLMAQRAVVRWGLALAVFLALGAVSYWCAGSLSTLGVRYLVSSRRLSSDDLIKVCRALDKQLIGYHIDEQRRVEVAADQFDQAAAVVSKLDLGQHPLDDIRNDAGSGNIWDGPGEREKKEQLKLEKILERLISDRDGVLSALVSINRPHSSAFSRKNPKPTAFVYVETEGGRSLPYRTIQSIPAILAGYVPDLTTESITVMDHRGEYLDPRNPSLADNSRNRAREEEISEEIIDKLDWIKGVRVRVQVTSAQAAASAGATNGTGVAAKRAVPVGPTSTSQSGTGPRPIQPRASGPMMRVNQPLDQVVDQETTSAPPAAPAPQAVAVNAAGSARAGESRHERGHVLIYVPRSFYYNIEIRTDEREPSREALRVMSERTEKQIRTAVGLVLPEPQSWKVEVDTIWDDVSLSRPAIIPGAPDSRHRFFEWGIVGALGAGASILAVAGSWIHMARRPARLPESSAKSRRYHVDTGSEPGPSERVRELIQRSPEAAASVLQRWVGQGGRGS